MKPRERDRKTAEEQRIISAELNRTAGELRQGARSSRADVHEQLAEGEHAIEERMLAVAEEAPDPDGVRRRGHAWSARAEEHMGRAADLRD